ncbi:hypothetical protein C8J57DRAFT_1478701 [Mycena rebaudengoi]|nr:hypothetical protein C8J57DRAFT_1478701 [Mycena rebaudengoi]
MNQAAVYMGSGATWLAAYILSIQLRGVHDGGLSPHQTAHFAEAKAFGPRDASVDRVNEATPKTVGITECRPLAFAYERLASLASGSESAKWQCNSPAQAQGGLEVDAGSGGTARRKTTELGHIERSCLFHTI